MQCGASREEQSPPIDNHGHTHSAPALGQFVCVHSVTDSFPLCSRLHMKAGAIAALGFLLGCGAMVLLSNTAVDLVSAAAAPVMRPHVPGRSLLPPCPEFEFLAAVRALTVPGNACDTEVSFEWAAGARLEDR